MCTEFPLGDDVVHVTVDADCAGDPKTRCSMSGGVSVGNRSVLHSTSLVSDMGNSVTILS